MADETPLSVHEPAGRARGGVLVVQEAFGVNTHIEAICARLAAEGWLAVAPHLYHRVGDPTFAYDDIAGARKALASLTPEAILDDLDVGFARIDAYGVPPEATGVIGFCVGGFIAVVAAVERGVGAAVDFYGGGIAQGRLGFPPHVDMVADLQVPLLGLFGDRDRSIPVEDVERLRAALDATGEPCEVVRYPDAGHGFNCDERDSYHEPSATDAWARTLAWFDRHLTAP
jgi:carboxymethylenebutenolidase